MAGIHRSSTLIWIKYRRSSKLGMAGIHRSSTLNTIPTLLPTLLGMAGIHRSSTLADRVRNRGGSLGMAGIHRSSTLGRAEPAEKQQVGAVFLFKKGEFAPGSLLVLAVFCHKRPPSCQIDDL